MADVKKIYEGCDCPHCMLSWAYLESEGNAARAMYAVGALIHDVMSSTDCAAHRLVLAHAIEHGGRDRAAQIQADAPHDLAHGQMANEKPV